MPNALDVDAANLAGESHVDAVDDADRFGGNEVATDDADARARHRRIGLPERKQRLNAAACVAHSLEDAVHCLRVGDAQSLVVATGNVLLLQYRLDLRARAVHHDQARAEAVQQVQIVHDAEEGLVGDDLATEGDDDRPAAQRVNVRRRGADPRHERLRIESHRHPWRGAGRSCGRSAGRELPAIFIASATGAESSEFLQRYSMQR